MKRKKLCVVIICILTFLAGVATALFMVYQAKSSDVRCISDNIVSFTTFAISCVAFVFSMITYFSIDAVNAITSMDGNVLENEKYSIAYAEIVDSFAACRYKSEFTEKLFDTVKLERRSASCMVFADEIQKIVDYLIWFAYVDLSETSVEKKCKKICRILDKEKARYNRLSNGINHILNENVKLIEYVLDYQKKRNEGKEYFVSELENVRGEMLTNPVSRIVYYDYLGLHYRRKAAEILNQCKEPSAEFSASHMEAIRKYQYSENQQKRYQCLSERARMCFLEAENLAKGNVLWTGYISYNQLRLNVMDYLVKNTPSYSEIMLQVEDVIQKREMVVFLFCHSRTYLKTKFQEEIERVQALKEALQEVNMREK